MKTYNKSTFIDCYQFEPTLPDYHNSLVNLMASIMNHYNIENHHPTIPSIDDLLKNNHKNVVLMLFDGMGMDALERHLPADSFLRTHLHQSITSVFPPTTAAATTTVETGKTPYEHGWLAWSLYIKELQQQVELLPNTIRNGKGQKAAPYHVAKHFMKQSFLYPQIQEKGGALACSVSPFGDIVIDSLVELKDTVVKLCEDEKPRYIYTYWTYPDSNMHLFGCGSEKVKRDIHEIDAMVASLGDLLSDTLLLVVADHGLIDVEYQYLTDYPNILATLDREPSMESRVCSFHIKPGEEENFVLEFKATFGKDYLLLSKQEIMLQGLFGNGKEHSRFQESVGDYIAIALTPKSIVYQPCKESETFAAAHSGLTKQEMMVPLIVIDKK